MTAASVAVHIAAWLYIASAIYGLALGIEWLQKRRHRE